MGFLLFVLFAAGSLLFAVLLLMEAGDVVRLPPALSIVVRYFLYFCLYGVLATTLFEVISISLRGGAP